MTKDDKISKEKEFDFIFEELENTFLELIEDFKKLKLKNKNLKEQVYVLSNDKENILKENEKLTQETKSLKEQKLGLTNEMNKISKENQTLKKEFKKIKSFVKKFTCSSEKLEMLLNNQRDVFNKAGLGFKPQKK